MTGSLIINNLAGLLIITSALILIVRKIPVSIGVLSLQALILVMIFFAIGIKFGAHELYTWGFTAIITKVILVPLIMYKAFCKMKDANIEESSLPTWAVIFIAAFIVLACYYVVKPVNIPMIQELKPVLAVSLGHFLIGLLCIVSQRNIIKQIFGYCIMENGAHLTLALLAYRVPELVEIGITTDAIFAVIVMSYFARRIYKVIGTLDADKLNMLKG